MHSHLDLLCIHRSNKSHNSYENPSLAPDGISCSQCRNDTELRILRRSHMAFYFLDSDSIQYLWLKSPLDLVADFAVKLRLVAKLKVELHWLSLQILDWSPWQYSLPEHSRLAELNLR
jgi:hypothetical protein